MSASTTAAVQSNPSDPHQDRRGNGPDAASRTGHLLNLVRLLIGYGRQLAASLQQRTPATDLADLTHPFGTIDIAKIIACITRGLHRAAALEARLTSRLARQQATPPSQTTASPRQPRAVRPSNESAGPPNPRIARLPTPGDIAAEIRRRPVGAVIADICRDLGILPSNPLWREIQLAIIENGGSLVSLFKDTWKRLSVWIINPPTTLQPATPAPCPPSAIAPGTGPP